MSKRAVSIASVCIVLTSVMASCNSDEDTIQETGPLVPSDLTSEAVDDWTGADRIALRPPRTGWNPGLVFQGFVDGDAVNAQRILCKNLFGDVTPQSDQLIIQTKDTQKDLDFSVGADLADDLIPGVGLEADIGKLHRGKHLKVNAKRGAYRYFTLEEQLKLTPTKSCLDAIAYLKQRDEFEERVFVIPAVYAVQGVTYEFANSTEVGSEVQANIQAIVDAALKAGYKKSTSGSGTEVITNDGWITLRTARPLFIREWDVSGLVGPQREVSVSLEEAPEQIELVAAPEEFAESE